MVIDHIKSNGHLFGQRVARFNETVEEVIPFTSDRNIQTRVKKDTDFPKGRGIPNPGMDIVRSIAVEGKPSNQAETSTDRLGQVRFYLCILLYWTKSGIHSHSELLRREVSIDVMGLKTVPAFRMNGIHLIRNTTPSQTKLSGKTKANDKQNSSFFEHVPSPFLSEKTPTIYLLSE